MAMITGPFVTYSEVTGVKPTEEDISSLLQPLDLRKVLFLLSRMNMHFRLASSAADVRPELAMGEAQRFLFINFTDEELFEQIKRSLSNTKLHERAVFHPFQMLNMVRFALKFCSTNDDSDGVTDSQRCSVGRCCLIMNDLLVSEEDIQKLSRGSENTRTAELMTQLLPGFEASNPENTSGLLNRSLGMFSMQISNADTKADILSRSGGYDFAQRFNDLVGVSLEHWIAILFSCIAYYYQYGGKQGIEQNYKYLWIDPRVFVGESKISQKDLDIVLGIISKTTEQLASVYSAPSTMRSSANVSPLKFNPLIRIGFLYICIDFAFLVEKLFEGAYWTLHDREDKRGRDRLASAWGILFERYVNWWAEGRVFRQPMIFHPFPVWDKKPSRRRQSHISANQEAFDGAILQGSRFVALEYKGSFLILEAKYSLNVRALLRNLNKKIGKACRQLAQGIGELFGEVPGRQLKDIPTHQVTRVIPAIVVQDQSLRSVGVNWWINRQFAREMRKKQLRHGVTVEPVTLIHIQEFETMIDSAEGTDFDLIGTLQLRNLRDPEAKSDLADVLLGMPGYGKQSSARRNELDREFRRSVLKYTFDITDFPENGQARR